MKGNLWVLLLLLPFFGNAQHLAYTVAGNDTSTAFFTLGDGGPATASVIGSTEGIWIDGNCNLYISDLGDSRIRKVNGTTGIITTIAGTTTGFSGDNGPATNAQIHAPYGLYADATGNVYFSDRNNKRIRRIDAVSGIITTFAGGGSSLGDGGPATAAQLSDPPNIFSDGSGNFYIGDLNRIRKINGSTGIITTIAGNGITGLSGDNGPATNAQLEGASGMIFDAHGDLIFADRSNSRIRKINMTTGIITTIAGTTMGYSGDGGQATAAQLSGPISIAIDYLGNLIIGDNQNNVFRKVDGTTGIITTIAGDTSLSAVSTEGAPATHTAMHPEFIYLDRAGNIYYSNYGREIRKITNYNPALHSWANTCGAVEVPQIVTSNHMEIYPNPTNSTLTIQASNTIGNIAITNILGQLVNETYTNADKADIDVGNLPAGLYFVKINGIYAGKFVKE